MISRSEFCQTIFDEFKPPCLNDGLEISKTLMIFDRAQGWLQQQPGNTSPYLTMLDLPSLRDFASAPSQASKQCHS